jgi:hypothetical protein
MVSFQASTGNISARPGSWGYAAALRARNGHLETSAVGVRRASDLAGEDDDSKNGRGYLEALRFLQIKG